MSPRLASPVTSAARRAYRGSACDARSAVYAGGALSRLIFAPRSRPVEQCRRRRRPKACLPRLAQPASLPRYDIRPSVASAAGPCGEPMPREMASRPTAAVKSVPAASPFCMIVSAAPRRSEMASDGAFYPGFSSRGASQRSNGARPARCLKCKPLNMREMRRVISCRAAPPCVQAK